MVQITLTQAAIRHLVADPKLQEWKRQDSNLKVPILGYYQRSYFTSKDGTVTEYGDGFMFTFDNPNMDWEGQGLVNERVPVGDKLNVLVLGPKHIFSKDFTIDWTEGKYSFEPQIRS